MVTHVYNLGSNAEPQMYTLPPREAVLAAYAQSLGDWNTWDYATKYGHLIEYGRVSVVCGDFSALLRPIRKDGKK